ncbi:MAG TPA: DoxX family membrane protein [Polyangiaceae bacterium]|nr:DoxX family membrane protein [Polyangiaceae bacterium]
MPQIKESVALAVLRIATGALVFPHGLRKLATGPVAAVGKSMVAHGFPAWFAYLVTAGELAGGLLALGLYTRFSAAAVAATLWGIVAFVQLPLARELGTGRGVALEYPILLALTATLFVLVPATKWSLGRGR